MDVIAVNQAGFTNAVATLGTALTGEQAVLMKRYALFLNTGVSEVLRYLGFASDIILPPNAIISNQKALMTANLLLQILRFGTETATESMTDSQTVLCFRLLT